MTTPERHNTDRNVVLSNAGSSENPWEDNLLAVPFAQDDEAREVEFRVGQHPLAHILCRLVGVGRQHDRADAGCAVLSQPQEPDIFRLGTVHQRWGMRRDDALHILLVACLAKLPDDPAKVLRSETILRFLKRDHDVNRWPQLIGIKGAFPTTQHLTRDPLPCQDKRDVQQRLLAVAEPFEADYVTCRPRREGDRQLTQHTLNLTASEGDGRVLEERTLVQNRPSSLDFDTDVGHGIVTSHRGGDLFRQARHFGSLLSPVGSSKHPPQKRGGRVRDVVKGVTARWQIVHLNGCPVVARHVRSPRRLTIIIDLGDVFDFLIDVTVSGEDGRKADPNTRRLGWRLHRHVDEERRNRRMRLILVGCLLKLDVHLDPELVIDQIRVNIRRNMEVFKLHPAERRQRTEQPSQRNENSGFACAVRAEDERELVEVDLGWFWTERLEVLESKCTDPHGRFGISLVGYPV